MRRGLNWAILTQNIRMRCFALFCAFFLTACAQQWNNGGFVGINSYDYTLWVWDVESNTSISNVCNLGYTCFSPAYTVDTMTRNLYYVYPAGNNRSVELTSRTFVLDETNNTFSCGEVQYLCKADWHFNWTSRLVKDSGLQLFVMVDTDWTEINKIRIWTFTENNCTLNLLQEYIPSRLWIQEADIWLYDNSNHFLYSVYITLDGETRIRGLNITSPSKGSFDVSWPSNGYPTTDSLPKISFDLSSGNITGALQLSTEKNYTFFTFNPAINPNVLYLFQNMTTIKYEMPTLTVDSRFDWKSGLYVEQRFQEVLDSDYQYSWNLQQQSEGPNFEFNIYTDNGWFYDPFLPVNVVNVNTASQGALSSGLPGVNSTIAGNIVNYRSKVGHFNVIEELLKVPGVTQSMFYQFRAYGFV